MTLFYILEDRQPVPIRRGTFAEQACVWAEWFSAQDNDQRQVAVDDFRSGATSLKVATHFIGHGMHCGQPVLFETMTFKNGIGTEVSHSQTYEQAVAEHQQAVAALMLAYPATLTPCP